MGFEESEVCKALAACGFNVEKALDELCKGMVYSCVWVFKKEQGSYIN
jgi:hypothetical protein